MNSFSSQSPGRHKAVWGPKRTVSALLIAFTCMAPNFAAAKTHSHEGQRKKAGVPGKLAKPYKLDDEMSKRSKDKNGNNTTRVIVTLVPGATLPPEFKKFSRNSSLDLINGQVLDLPNGVLKAMGVSENDPKITVPFCIEALNDAREYTRMKLYGIRHAWLAQFEFPIQVLAGSNFVYLPEDIDFNETDRSMLSGRFIMNNVLAPFNLKYIDKRSWNQVAFNVGGSVTVGETAVAAVVINLESAGDFLPAKLQPVGRLQRLALQRLP